MKGSKEIVEALYDLIIDSVPDLPCMRDRLRPLHDLILDALVRHIRRHYVLPDSAVDDEKLRTVLEIVSHCLNCHFRQSTSHYRLAVKIVVEALTGTYVEGLVRIQNWSYYRRAGVGVCYEWVKKFLEGCLDESVVSGEKCVEPIGNIV